MRFTNFFQCLYYMVIDIPKREEHTEIICMTDDLHINKSMSTQILYHYCEDGHIKRLKIDPFTITVKVAGENGKTIYESYSIDFQELLWRVAV